MQRNQDDGLFRMEKQPAGSKLYPHAMSDGRYLTGMRDAKLLNIR